jgi:hypothetical protein
MRQHLRRFIHSDDRVAERYQRMGDPPGTAAQFEDGRAWTQTGVMKFRMVHLSHS